MSDRKYRLRGYQDDDRDRQPKPRPARPAQEPGAPAGARRISQDGPRNINMPGFREVVRCAPCGATLSADIGFDSLCPRCGTELHACSQCGSFDPGARFECMQPVTARISPKNAKNTCPLYAPRLKEMGRRLCAWKARWYVCAFFQGRCWTRFFMSDHSRIICSSLPSLLALSRCLTLLAFVCGM